MRSAIVAVVFLATFFGGVFIAKNCEAQARPAEVDTMEWVSVHQHDSTRVATELLALGKELQDRIAQCEALLMIAQGNGYTDLVLKLSIIRLQCQANYCQLMLLMTPQERVVCNNGAVPAMSLRSAQEYVTWRKLCLLLVNELQMQEKNLVK